ncbi:MAG: FG-GAP-like repeat-containing protein [Acidobacteria bacterium]|nr:FG-GAP-like repeat-containing protein [Acidobacteriota bacterium]
MMKSDYEINENNEINERACKISFISLFSFISLSFFFLTSCNGGGKLPAPPSTEYRDAISAFYIGLGALQATDDNRAKQKLTQFTQLAPGEPAGWVNLGVLALRQQEFDAAYQHLEKARELDPKNSRIEGMLGLVETKRGRFAEAIAHLRKAVELDPKNLIALYALAQEIERQGGENNEAETQSLIEKILQAQPDNLAAQLELTRIAAKRGDVEATKRAVARIGERASNWPPEINQQFTALQAAANGPNVRAAASQVAFLRNVLVRLPEYRQSLAAIKYPTEETGQPFETFIKMQRPKFEQAAPDLAMTFELQPIAGVGEGNWNWVKAISLNGEGQPSLAVGNSGEVRIIGGSGLKFPNKESLSSGVGGTFPFQVLAIDLNYDFKTDLIFAGSAGLRFYRQTDSGSFVDVTSSTKLPAKVINSDYLTAVCSADFDLDGDLDVFLGGETIIVLRNNGDGTFKEIHSSAFSRFPILGDLSIADFDGDGDPDIATLSMRPYSGTVFRVFSNERLGEYRERQIPPGMDNIASISAADLNEDGVTDLIALRGNGEIVRLTDKSDGKDWEISVVSTVKPPEPSHVPSGLRIADFDNNGGLDLLAGEQVLLSDGQGNYQPLNYRMTARFVSVVDVTGDGRLDLAGIDPGSGKPVQLVNRGTKNYHWQFIRPRAAKATGDQRINSFGIGGEMEIRAGLLFQKQVINSPIVHFGLGEQTQTDVLRIIWPNGSIQGEFELKLDQVVLAEQRLKGSCPSLFAWNGKAIEFVKDCAPWSPALGLHINAQVTAGIQQTEEWMKIRGDQLAPRDGYYDLRITAELWETYYIDHYSLIIVDHPANTEVYTDERFAIPPPELKIYATSIPRPFTRAWDDRGQDVTDVVRTLDEKYLDTFGRGNYQGVTRDHFVELELPQDIPNTVQPWLIAHGFVHPTDGTVNIALSQPDNYIPPKGLSLEAPDGKGGWRVVNPSIGFPAGKQKTIFIDLSQGIRQNSERRVRLRTNMELYWDKLEWAEGLPEAQIKTNRINAESAELRYRGFSVMRRADDSSPELPDYNQLEFTGQKWRDLIGYYTRHGDIRELLEKVDDRFAIVNAGDEMRFRFKAIPDPPAGWKRDFVMIGNGWIKDGDYNSNFSKTVLPLPDAKMREYTKAQNRLEDDPVYQRHSRDWQEFHTRYVTPDRFRNAMRTKEERHETNEK